MARNQRTHFWRQALFSGLLLLLLTSGVPAQSPASGISESDVVLKAMQDELARTLGQLQVKDLEKPYFVEYVITDQEIFSTSATFGALVYTNRNRYRTLQTQVRVGDYTLDNSGFLSQQDLFSINLPSEVPVDDEYNALRHSLWLGTDAAYKQAVEAFARKQAFLRNRSDEEPLPDFSHEDPVRLMVRRQPMQVDQTHWEQQVREWSAVFRQFPDIQESNVSLQATQIHTYLVNNEGTVVREPQLIICIEARASTQAADGSRIRHAVPVYAARFDQVPPALEIASRIRAMAEELSQLRTAPVLADPYSGPVLFTGQAACEMFAQVLPPQFSGQRPPLVEQEEYAAALGFAKSELAARLNRPVFPPTVSILDDPTQVAFRGQSLIGGYQVDDQGVAARPVPLVENGILKTLLMSRRPRKGIDRSNGHGRAVPFAGINATISNLFIQPREGKSEGEIKQELIALCKQENLPFGIWVKVLSVPGGWTDVNDAGDAANSYQREGLTAPVSIYKVYVDDGREELVRGIKLGGVSFRQFKRLSAIGQEVYVHNRIATGGGASIDIGQGSAGLLGLPTTVVAPSVLIEDVELRPITGPRQKPVLLNHPYFSR